MCQQQQKYTMMYTLWQFCNFTFPRPEDIWGTYIIPPDIIPPEKIPPETITRDRLSLIKLQGEQNPPPSYPYFFYLIFILFGAIHQK